MSLTKFLDPRNDMAFKKIFGSEKNKDILIHFLNDMLDFKEKQPIKEVQFLKTVQDPDVAAKKTSVVDVICTDELGNSYIVEMQVTQEKGFAKRAQYYAAKAYGSQLKINGKYQDLKEVIFLAITDFIMFPNKSAYKSDHVILDKDSLDHDLKDFSFTFLELEKFNKNIDELKTIIERWIYFFKHAKETSKEDLIKIIGNEKCIQRAYEELDRFNWNEEELNAYEAAAKKQLDYEAAMDQKYDEGLAKGNIIGEVRGDYNARVEFAKKLLKQNMAIEAIVNLTGLTTQQIENLTITKD
jgi:predicted transposase/invertase (TIGR01784 family)